MSIFGRKAKRTARSVASGLKSSSGSSSSGSAKKADAADKELEALKAQLEEERERRMRAEWRVMYEAGCDGDCDNCEYYDVCDGDFVDEAEPAEAKKPASAPAEESAAAKADEEMMPVSSADSTSEALEAPASSGKEAGSVADAEEDPEEAALREQEQALYAEAAAYYEAGCDGDCDNCEYYDYCPAEEDDPDKEELAFGVTQGDVKNFAKGGMSLARETAATMKDLKEASDEFRDIVDVRRWFK